MGGSSDSNSSTAASEVIDVERALIDESDNALASPCAPRAHSDRALSFAEQIRIKTIENGWRFRYAQPTAQPQEQDPFIPTGLLNPKDVSKKTSLDVVPLETEGSYSASREQTGKEEKLLALPQKSPAQWEEIIGRPLAVLALPAPADQSRASRQFTEQQQRLLDLFHQPPARSEAHAEGLSFDVRGRTQKKYALLGMV